MQLKKILLGILLMTTIVVMPAFGQGAYNIDRDAKLFTAQGQTYTIQNRIGALNLTFEYVVAGSPTTLVLTITGCMRGGSCDPLDTYSGTANTVRKITGLYDNYVVTVTTLSGGTTPTVQMNAFYTAASSPASQLAITPIVSAAAEGSHVLKTSGGQLYSLYVTTGATAGFLMTFNATSAPGDGAVTPVECVQVPANTTVSVSFGPGPPDAYATGITAVFSSTGCFTKTVSATAFFKARVQ